TLKRYIDELSVTGLTSNPTIFNQAIKNSSAYSAAIRVKLSHHSSAEEVFFELALEDLTRAADLFRPIFDRTNGVDGWVSLEVSPRWPTTREARWPRRRVCSHARRDRTCSSRSPAPRKGYPLSRKRSLLGFPSM